MKKFFSKTSRIILICSLLTCPIYAKNSDHFQFRPGFFVGISGTSFIIFLVDVILDADGEVVKSAGEWGLLTGEIGVSFDIRFYHFGIRPEALIGYYKYQVLKIPNTSYTIFHAGMEPYFYFEGFNLGLGTGVFFGIWQQDFLDEQISDGQKLNGISFWFSLGIETGKHGEVTARLRLHHFNELNLNDVIFSLRVMLWY